jgi:transcriptional regulator with XRE-family HTH domain
MVDLRKLRESAGVTQIEAAVRAKVSPPLVRNYERFGARAVEDDAKRSRLESVYDGLRREIEARGGAAA